MFIFLVLMKLNIFFWIVYYSIYFKEREREKDKGKDMMTSISKY